MSDFYTKKQRKYWCDVCHIFIAYNKDSIDKHNNSNNHINNSLRGNKLYKARNNVNNYVQRLEDNQNIYKESKFNNNNANNKGKVPFNFLGNKRKPGSLNNNIDLQEIKKEIFRKKLNENINKANDDNINNKNDNVSKVDKNWEINFDKRYKEVYYYNKETKNSQWNKPDNFYLDDTKILEYKTQQIKLLEFKKLREKEGRVGKFEKITRQNADFIFGKRKDEFLNVNEKLNSKETKIYSININ